MTLAHVEVEKSTKNAACNLMVLFYILIIFNKILKAKISDPLWSTIGISMNK